MNVKTGLVIVIVLCSIFIAGSTIFAQQPSQSQQEVAEIEAGIRWWIVLESAIYAIMGVILSFIAYKLYDLLTPFSLNKELAEDQNIAIGILVGSIFIGIAIIIGASIFG